MDRSRAFAFREIDQEESDTLIPFSCKAMGCSSEVPLFVTKSDPLKVFCEQHRSKNSKEEISGRKEIVSCNNMKVCGFKNKSYSKFRFHRRTCSFLSEGVLQKFKDEFLSAVLGEKFECEFCLQKIIKSKSDWHMKVCGTLWGKSRKTEINEKINHLNKHASEIEKAFTAYSNRNNDAKEFNAKLVEKNKEIETLIKSFEENPNVIRQSKLLFVKEHFEGSFPSIRVIKSEGNGRKIVLTTFAVADHLSYEISIKSKKGFRFGIHFLEEESEFSSLVGLLREAVQANALQDGEHVTKNDITFLLMLKRDEKVLSLKRKDVSNECKDLKLPDFGLRDSGYFWFELMEEGDSIQFIDY